MRESKYVYGVSEGNSLIVRADADAGSLRVGTLRNNQPVTVLAVSGDRSLVAVGTAGWVASAYLVDELPRERLDYTLGEYNDVVSVTSADADKLIGESFTVGRLLLRDDLGAQLVSPSLVALFEAAEEYFGGTVEFVTRNSLYRTPESNAAAGGAGRSKHMEGYAADFMVRTNGGYVQREELARFAENYIYERGWQGGVGVYAGSTEHIHADLRGGWTFWWQRTTGSNTPGFGGRPTVFKRGDRSPAIMDIQAFLNSEGFDAGTADGVFGPRTESALTSWQEENGLAADGAYGSESEATARLFGW